MIVDNLQKNYEKSAEVISVTQLNKFAKDLLENGLPIVWIKGEISGLKRYSHLYFDLKDETSKISCVMFSRSIPTIDFDLENGQKIEVRGKVTIYPTNGSYQINVERVRKVGLGELWEAYNRLLVKLREEGLFDSQKKKSIPIFPKKIGIITSKEGAVIRDIITTLRRRMANIPLIIYHSAVQGADASMQIAKAIRTANSRNEVDVLIVCRGGGSMEDLWCFNEEVVAREVYLSRIPIISAVGHETDTTIIDYVADLRAPTPTAAAELVAKSRDEWLNLILRLKYLLNNNFSNYVSNKQQQLDLKFAKLKLLHPQVKLSNNKNILLHRKQFLSNGMVKILLQKKSRVDLISSKLNIDFIIKRINQEKIDLSRLSKLLDDKMRSLLVNRFTKIDNFSNSLNLLNPHNVLSRGYSIVRNSKGNIIRTTKDVKHNERIEVILKDDILGAIADKNYNPHQSELL